MIIWALFDSGNGCYTQAVGKYFPQAEIFPIGVDIENKNSHFINLNLADYSEIFNGKSPIFDKLDTLPKPDIILASPPCESWSLWTSLKGGTNFWQMTQEINTLFGEVKVPTAFTLQTRENFDKALENRHGFFKAHWHKTLYKRVNGELCAYNTLRIIERYNPKIWVIENPQTSKIWEYFQQIHDFVGIKNIAHYNYYDENFPKKPTCFLSNIDLNLKITLDKAKASLKGLEGRPSPSTYNERSDIPLELIKKILNKAQKEISK